MNNWQCAAGELRIEIFDINGRTIDNMAVVDGAPVPPSNGRGDLAPTEIIWQPGGKNRLRDLSRSCEGRG